MSHSGNHSKLQLWLQGPSFHHVCSARFANKLGRTPPSAQPPPFPRSSHSIKLGKGSAQAFGSSPCSSPTPPWAFLPFLE